MKPLTFKDWMNTEWPVDAHVDDEYMMAETWKAARVGMVPESGRLEDLLGGQERNNGRIEVLTAAIDHILEQELLEDPQGIHIVFGWLLGTKGALEKVRRQ